MGQGVGVGTVGLGVDVGTVKQGVDVGTKGRVQMLVLWDRVVWDRVLVLVLKAGC